jgi:hypothetical protein
MSTMPRAPSLRTPFLVWMCFSLHFSTVFQAFVAFFLESSYKTPIQNTDELFASGIRLAYPAVWSSIFENGDETVVPKLQRNSLNFPLLEVCMYWTKAASVV